MGESEPLPHSKTVRGTLSNPKTQEAIKHDRKPEKMLGDPGSLKAEDTSTDPVPGKNRQDGGTVDLDDTSSSSSSSCSSGSAHATEGGKIEGIEWQDGKKGAANHSKSVRGTLGNRGTQEAIRKGKEPPQVGDQSSLVKEKNGDATKSKL